MKEIILKPKQKALLYFAVIGVLLFIHTYILKNDKVTWVLLNLNISCLIAIYCAGKGCKELREKVIIK